MYELDDKWKIFEIFLVIKNILGCHLG